MPRDPHLTANGDIRPGWMLRAVTLVAGLGVPAALVSLGLLLAQINAASSDAADAKKSAAEAQGKIALQQQIVEKVPAIVDSVGKIQTEQAVQRTILCQLFKGSERPPACYERSR